MFLRKLPSLLFVLAEDERSFCVEHKDLLFRVKPDFFFQSEFAGFGKVLKLYAVYTIIQKSHLS